MTFDGGADDDAYSVEQTSDGDYIAAGYTEAAVTGNRDAWIIKLDRFGRAEWSKTFGGEALDRVTSIIQTSDGGYVFTGGTCSYGNGKCDVWLMKMDSAGNELWSKTFGGGENEYASSVNQTADGGYIVAANTGSYGAGESDAWIIKLDSSGNQTWAKTLGGPNDDSAHDIEQASDGGYFVAGGTYEPGPEPSEWVVKLDANGNQLWSKPFGVAPTDDSECPASYEEYIKAGLSDAGGGIYYVWVMNIDNSGNGDWAKIFEGTGYVSGGVTERTSDGGFISASDVSGIIGSAMYIDLFALKLDSCGNEEWTKSYGGARDDYANSIRQTSDGGYVVAGKTKSYGIGDSDFWVLRLDSNGDCPGCF